MQAAVKRKSIKTFMNRLCLSKLFSPDFFILPPRRYVLMIADQNILVKQPFLSLTKIV